MAAPDPRSIFPTHHLRDRDGSAAPPGGGETLYVIFHTGCPTSELTWPYLERLRQIGAGRGLRIVAVSQDGPEETRAFQNRLGGAAEMLYEPSPWRVSEALGLQSVPAFARVAPDGRIEELVVGFQREKMAGFAARSAALAGVAAAEFYRPDENVPAIRPG